MKNETKPLEEKVLESKDKCQFADKNGYAGSEYICKYKQMNVCLEPERYLECIHYKQYLKKGGKNEVLLYKLPKLVPK